MRIASANPFWIAKKAQNFVGWLALSTLRNVQPNQPDRMSETTIQNQQIQASDHQIQNIESLSTRLSHAHPCSRQCLLSTQTCRGSFRPIADIASLPAVPGREVNHLPGLLHSYD